MKNTSRLAIDATMFVAIVALMNPEVTGVNLHIGLGIALLLPALMHVALNWESPMHTIDRVFEKLRSGSRFNLAMAVMLFATFVAVSLSGIMVVPVIANAFISSYSAWHALHSASAWAFTALAVTHLVLHARWIGGVVRRAVSTPSPEGVLR